MSYVVKQPIIWGEAGGDIHIATPTVELDIDGLPKSLTLVMVSPTSRKARVYEPVKTTSRAEDERLRNKLDQIERDQAILKLAVETIIGHSIEETEVLAAAVWLLRREREKVKPSPVYDTQLEQAVTKLTAPPTVKTASQVAHAHIAGQTFTTSNGGITWHKL